MATEHPQFERFKADVLKDPEARAAYERAQTREDRERLIDRAAEVLGGRFARGRGRWRWRMLGGQMVDASWRPTPLGNAVEQAATVLVRRWLELADSGTEASPEAFCRDYAERLAAAGLLRSTECDDPIECSHEAALGEVEAKLEHLQTELAGMSDMATRTRDHRQQEQFDALHRAIGEAVGYDPDAPWPGNAKAAEDLRALRDENADLQALFELQWKRSREAEALWRAEDPERRRNVGPDLGVLLEWLIKRGNKVEGEATDDD